MEYTTQRTIMTSRIYRYVDSQPSVSIYPTLPLSIDTGGPNAGQGESSSSDSNKSPQYDKRKYHETCFATLLPVIEPEAEPTMYGSPVTYIESLVSYLYNHTYTSIIGIHMWGIPGGPLAGAYFSYIYDTVVGGWFIVYQEEIMYIVTRKTSHVNYRGGLFLGYSNVHGTSIID